MSSLLRPIFVIAKNTYREIIRDRILYGLFVFAILLIGFSLVLGQLTFAEQARISADLGFTAIHIASVIMAIFVGSTLVGREIEKKTIMTLLVRPISRTQFVVGKSFGLLAVIVVAAVILSTLLSLIFLFMGLDLAGSFFVGIYGIILEAALLLTITIFFGSFASPMLSVSFALGIFLIGHWIESLKFFIEKSDNPTFVIVSKGIVAIHPNLEVFNWRSLFVYADPVNYEQVMWGTFYSLTWCIFLVASSSLILSRRDLG